MAEMAATKFLNSFKQRITLDDARLLLRRPHIDPILQLPVLRLHRLTVWLRWIVAAALWLTVAPISIWNLRSEISLWLDYFTWVAVWYGVRAHLWAGIGLGLCVAMTLGILLWQSRNIVWGLPPKEQRTLERYVRQIHSQGTSHPLWEWVFGD